MHVIFRLEGGMRPPIPPHQTKHNVHILQSESPPKSATEDEVKTKNKAKFSIQRFDVHRKFYYYITV